MRPFSIFSLNYIEDIHFQWQLLSRLTKFLNSSFESVELGKNLFHFKRHLKFNVKNYFLLNSLNIICVTVCYSSKCATIEIGTQEIKFSLNFSIIIFNSRYAFCDLHNFRCQKNGWFVFKTQKAKTSLCKPTKKTYTFLPESFLLSDNNYFSRQCNVWIYVKSF